MIERTEPPPVKTGAVGDSEVAVGGVTPDARRVGRVGGQRLRWTTRLLRQS